MGVKCLLLYKLPPGASLEQEHRKLVDALESLSAVPEAGEKVEGSCTIYRQKPRQEVDLQAVQKPVLLRDVWVVQLAANASRRCYLIQRSSKSLAEADAHVMGLLTRHMQYQGLGATITLLGKTWRMGDASHPDITFKLLQVRQATSQPMALAVEIGYQPVPYLQTGQPLLNELADAVRAALGPDGSRLEPLQTDFAAWSPTDVPAEQVVTRLPDEYSLAHTAITYAELVAASLVGQAKEQQQQQQQQSSGTPAKQQALVAKQER